jgi:hypothetical protein
VENLIKRRLGGAAEVLNRSETPFYRFRACFKSFMTFKICNTFRDSVSGTLCTLSTANFRLDLQLRFYLALTLLVQ